MKSEALALPATRSRLRVFDYLALTKPRLNFLVILTTAVGYYLGAGRELDLVALFNTVVGTALVAGGAAGLNQILERDVDGLMARTRGRPLPEGRLPVAEASWFALGLCTAGVLQLAMGANRLAAMVALATAVTYTVVYTPLKRRTSLATLVGAVPGALPPVIGWVAVRGSLGSEPLALFAIVFLWQVPHFLAIAWMYRADYERAGFPLLAVVDASGRSTAYQTILYTAVLLPVSLSPTLIGLTGGGYFAGALALGTAFLLLAGRFAHRRTLPDARRLFVGSIVYLPLLWALMIADRIA